MKRSHMLLKIQEMLVELPEDVEKAAESLLKRLEKAGMVPPAVTRHPDAYNRSEGTYGYEVHEWESEDAT